MKVLLFLSVMSMLLVACGGGDDKASQSADRVLHFSGRDETEANFRERVRSLRFAVPDVFKQTCGRIVGLNAKAAAEKLRTDPAESDGSIPKGATAKPGQKAVEADIERSAEIVLEECKN